MDWQRRFFAEDYLTLFGPYVEGERADAEAVRTLALLEVGAGARVLDLACGQGRHAVALRRAGLDVVGLDLSAVLLRAAADRDPGLPLLRGDMRQLPLTDACVDGTLNLFNAFGYFDDDAQDVGVCGRSCGCCVPAGGSCRRCITGTRWCATGNRARCTRRTPTGSS